VQNEQCVELKVVTTIGRIIVGVENMEQKIYGRFGTILSYLPLK
jgi:hypothetical protein